VIENQSSLSVSVALSVYLYPRLFYFEFGLWLRVPDGRDLFRKVSRFYE
jgi:hypothetical protein